MNNGKHIVDIVFILALICVFSVSALFVVISGADVYSAVTAESMKNSDTRTSLSYIEQKVRQHDAAGGVRVGSVDGSDALILSVDYESGSYDTWIMCSGGSLREVMVAEGVTPSGGDGQALMELDALSVSADASGLLHITVQNGGSSDSLILSPRCGGAL